MISDLPTIQEQVEALSAAILESEKKDKDKPKNTITRKERLIWLLKTLIREGRRLVCGEDLLIIPVQKLMVAPYFDANIEQTLCELLEPVQLDKDFYRRHNMANYKPDFVSDDSLEFSDKQVFIFSDFTEDFMNEYAKDRLGVKINAGEYGNKPSIKSLELLKDETDLKGITVYINGDYNNPRHFLKKKRWGEMYELAKTQAVPLNKKFFDYFNYSHLNPLYTNKSGFKVTAILKERNGVIIPNIEIGLLTQKQVSSKKLKPA